MSKQKIILVCAALGTAGLVGLGGCGQKGPLYLPTAPEAAQRGTLPQVLQPDLPRGSGAGTPSQKPASVPAAVPAR
ncbi:MAG: LPS translocon maturation chaperone LptM [Burkholderiaceae bacterium]